MQFCFFYKQKTAYDMRNSNWSSDVCSSDLAEAGDDSTRLTLRHSAPLDDKSEEFWDRFGPGAVGVGWDLSLMGLGWHIETGESNERFAEETWALSDEGKAFATWSKIGRAHV